MGILQTVVDEAFDVGEKYADQYGKDSLAREIHAYGIAADADAAVVDKHPVAEFAGIIAATVASIYLAPILIPAGETLAESPVGRKIAQYLVEKGLSEDFAAKTVMVGAKSLVSQTAAETTDEIAKDGYEKLYNLLSDTSGNDPSNGLSVNETDDNGNLLYGVQAGHLSSSIEFNNKLGALTTIYQDFEGPEHSALKTFDLGGGENTFVYSEPGDSGDVINSYQTNIKNETVGFDNHVVSDTGYAPDLISSNVTSFEKSTVDENAVEFNSNDFQGVMPPSGSIQATETVDFKNSSIQYLFDPSEDGDHFYGNTFNGSVFRITDPNAPTITGATISSTNLTGLGQESITFADHAVAINLLGTTLPKTGQGIINIAFNFAHSG